MNVLQKVSQFIRIYVTFIVFQNDELKLPVLKLLDEMETTIHHFATYILFCSWCRLQSFMIFSSPSVKSNKKLV